MSESRSNSPPYQDLTKVSRSLIQHSKRTSSDLTQVSRTLIERSMELRCQAYLSNAKHMLLMQTLMDLDASKRYLAKTTKELKELDKLKTMFIASLTHEFNNPLSAIIGYSEMVADGVAGPLTEKQQKFLQNVIHSAEHLKHIVSDALDISKIDSDAIEPHYEEFPLCDVVSDSISFISQQAEQKGIAINVDVDKDISLYNDRTRLEQCLINLLSNAVKYTNSGTISLTGRNREEAVVLSVSDTGVGLSQDDLDHLFEAFNRGGSAKRTNEMGTGIGLYLTNKLVHLILKGTISVESELDRGATFTITIPRSVT